MNFQRNFWTLSIVLSLLLSAGAFAGSPYDITISSLLDQVPDSSVTLDVSISNGSGSSHTTTGITLLASAAGEVVGDMGSTSTVTDIDLSGGVYDGGSKLIAAPNYGAAAPAGPPAPTGVGLVFKLEIDIPGDANPGEVYVFDFDTAGTNGVFNGASALDIGTLTPGTITIIPEPSGCLMIGLALIALASRRRFA